MREYGQPAAPTNCECCGRETVVARPSDDLAVDQAYTNGYVEGMKSARPSDDLTGAAWGIIANAGGGDWTKETPEWQEAAAAWRERYHAALAAEGSGE